MSAPAAANPANPAKPAATAADDAPYVSVFAKSGGFEGAGAKFHRKMMENPLVPVGARDARVAACRLALLLACLCFAVCLFD